MPGPAFHLTATAQPGGRVVVTLHGERHRENEGWIAELLYAASDQKLGTRDVGSAARCGLCLGRGNIARSCSIRMEPNTMWHQ